MNGKEFAKWMDDSGVNLETAATHFGVSQQTIYNWRSTSGIPASRDEWVRLRMHEYLEKQGIAELPNRVVLEPSRKQWRAWGHAALAAGQILDEWALAALDDAAARDQDGNDLAGHGGASTPSPQSIRTEERRTRRYSIEKNLVV
jgi:hypothetical protein